ncbi:hypothetical protein M0638_06340 [Roseomonas sp. NAR14]|uniref:Uncharacterized protein n=1 Tax=Roseomonas acroporae TaxID=2937791 RepID=A0A9X1Y6I6_9PROT|nr:hypothetical protein [Roseomonas acroporae]MCK8783998.1 hypothetical protein [Roseomonas acroporae]
MSERARPPAATGAMGRGTEGSRARGRPAGGRVAACRIALALLALLAGASAVPAQAQQRGYQGAAGWLWFASNADLGTCLQTVAGLLRQGGYVVDEIGPNENAVVAGKAGDFFIVTCIPQRQAISIAWNGRQVEDHRAMVSRISGALRAGGAPGGAPQPYAPPQGQLQGQPQGQPQGPSQGMPLPTKPGR